MDGLVFGQQSKDCKLAFRQCLIERQWAYIRAKISEETQNAGYLCFNLCEPHNLPGAKDMRELSFLRSLVNYLEGIQKRKQLHWAGSFGPFLSYVRRHKLVLGANAKRFS